MMRNGHNRQIQLRGRRVDYRLVLSRSARKLRIRIGLNGVEVVRPAKRTDADMFEFLDRNEDWILDQIKRVDRLNKVNIAHRPTSHILFRGEPTHVRIERTAGKSRGNLVRLVDGEIVVRRSSGSRTPAACSLENWFRRQARIEIKKQLESITSRLRQRPQRLYIMDQRTKWGNCSTDKNLSFSWRLILAPEFVLRYLVTHEAVHLAVPDHSARFWLTVQSLCSETERAKRWLSANQSKITIKLETICDQAPLAKRPARQRAFR